MHPILPAWSDSDAELHERLGRAIDPERKVLAALERIVPLGGRRIADVGTGIGHYPMLLARRTGRTYGFESDPELLAEARRRASASHQPNLRIVEGKPTALPLRDAAVDIVLTSRIEPDDASLPAVAEAMRVLRPGGRLIVIGYYGRDDVSALLEPEVVAHAARRPSDAPAGGCGTGSRSRSSTPASTSATRRRPTSCSRGSTAIEAGPT
jgi:SAM-dependent methyltransferase